MVRDVLSLYRKDPKRWQAAWRFLVDKYQNDPAYCRASNGAIDVKINGAMVLLGFLFGEGDVDATMRIATAGGYDSDCNPSSAAGVLGTMIGKSRLDEKYTKLFDRSRKFSYTSYDFNGLVRVCERLARQIVVAEGGSVERDGSGKECFLVPHQTVKPRSLELSWAPGPVASSRYTPHECAEIEDYRPMPDLATFEDADPRRRVQKALDALAPGWTVDPVGNGEGKGRAGLYEGHCREDYIVVVVPSNGTDSVSMTRRVTVGAGASLLVRAAADDQHRKDPWTLEVFVNGKRIGKQDLTGYYEDFSFPLPDSAGAVADVEIRAIGACACFSRIRLDQGVQAHACSSSR